MNKVAVVIINWNGEKFLRKFLRTNLNYSKEAVLYIVDNASTDGSINYVKNNFPSVQIIKLDTNHGYAKGYNLAVKKIKENIICFLNSDVEVTKNWIIPCLKALTENKNLAVVQPKVLNYNKQTVFEHAGAAGGYIDAYCFPFCRGRLFNTIEKDTGQYNTDASIFWGSGACMFIKKTAFNEVDGFDDDYFAYQEEVDMCWRLKNLGYEIKYISSSRVFHIGSVTLTNKDPKKTFLNFRNSLFTLFKNVPSNVLIYRLFIRFILDGTAFFVFIFSNSFRHSIAILKAHLSFYHNLKLLLKKRKKQAHRLRNYYHSRSIVFNYFILQRKTFNQIKEY